MTIVHEQIYISLVNIVDTHVVSQLSYRRYSSLTLFEEFGRIAMGKVENETSKHKDIKCSPAAAASGCILFPQVIQI